MSLPVDGEFLADDEQDDGVVFCHKCKCHMQLDDGAEWPEDKTLILCQPCAVEEVEALRGVRDRLVNAAKNAVEKLGRFVDKGFLVSHDRTIQELRQAIDASEKPYVR